MGPRHGQFEEPNRSPRTGRRRSSYAPLRVTPTGARVGDGPRPIHDRFVRVADDDALYEGAPIWLRRDLASWLLSRMFDDRQLEVVVEQRFRLEDLDDYSPDRKQAIFRKAREEAEFLWTPCIWPCGAPNLPSTGTTR